MRVLIAPSRFAGTLSAGQAAAAIAEGWRLGAPRDAVALAPMSDGGPGFLDVVAPAVGGGQLLAVTSVDPWGRPVPASILLTAANGLGNVATGASAYVEAAQVLLPAPDGAPGDSTTASSHGLGLVLRQALEAGARRIVVGLGGATDTAVHDAGAGLLAALGVGGQSGAPPGPLDGGGLALADLQPRDVDGLADVVGAWRGVDLVLAARDDLPLLGLHGTSAVEAQDRGATPAQAQALEAAFGHWASLTGRALPATGRRTDLLTGAPPRLDRAAGSGAGGGLGYGVLLLGGRVVDGAALTGDVIGLAPRAAGADVLVTGEGSFGWRSLRRSVQSHVAGIGLEAGVPSVVIAGRVEVGRRETMSAGFSGAYAVAERADQREAALADPAGTLAARARRVARTWSPTA